MLAAAAANPACISLPLLSHSPLLLLSSSPLSEYPHKYGSEGGCADHSVFERMRRYQESATEQPVQVGVCTTLRPPVSSLDPRSLVQTPWSLVQTPWSWSLVRTPWSWCLVQTPWSLVQTIDGLSCICKVSRTLSPTHFINKVGFILSPFR